MEEKKIIAYKGFDKNLKCREFQYEVGKEYEMSGRIECCERGFHACESPLEVFDHYDMLNSRFAKVEQSGEIDKEENSTKVCSSKIKVKAELKLADIINIGVEWIKDVTSPAKLKKETNLDDNGGDSAKIGSSGDSAQIGSCGYSAQIGSCGDSAKIGSCGYSAKIGSSGDSAKIGSCGDSAKIGSCGDSAQIGSSGDSAQIGSSGDSVNIGSCGNSAKIGSSGDYVNIGSCGYSAKIGSCGDYAQIGSCGDSAQIGSCGYSAQIGSCGDSAKIGSCGYSAKIESTGNHTVVMAAGNNSIAKAKIGSWITLAEWDCINGVWIPICVKTEQVDGERIKADTFYKLVNGEFKEVEE